MSSGLLLGWKIWDAMHGGEFGNSWRVRRNEKRKYFVNRVDIQKFNGNTEWGRLVKVLDMSEKQWDEYKDDDDTEYSATEEDEADSSFEPEEILEINQG